MGRETRDARRDRRLADVRPRGGAAGIRALPQDHGHAGGLGVGERESAVLHREREVGGVVAVFGILHRNRSGGDVGRGQAIDCASEEVRVTRGLRVERDLDALQARKGGGRCGGKRGGGGL